MNAKEHCFSVATATAACGQHLRMADSNQGGLP
jgi:hypothetical protein